MQVGNNICGKKLHKPNNIHGENMHISSSIRGENMQNYCFYHIVMIQYGKRIGGFYVKKKSRKTTIRMEK